MKRQFLSIAIYVLATCIGVLAFIYPFFIQSTSGGVMGQAHAADSPLLLTVLVGLCFVVLLLEVQGESVNAKFVALLGILVAMNSVLRFLEVAVPGPGGISPIFFLIVLTGYVFGGRFGFLMGALSLLVSSLITGSIGPWLPYQMFTAGWVGMSAPLCRLFVRSRNRVAELLVLMLFAGLWGFVYGAIINIWFWPFAAGPAGQHWEEGLGLFDALRRYGAFYLATSFLWDAMRGIGNAVMIIAFGAPTLKALRRFQRRFAFNYRPVYGGEVQALAEGDNA